MQRVFGLFAVFLLCTACYSWRRIDVPEHSSGKAWATDRRSRVELSSGTEIRFERVRVEGDTLFGTDSKNRRMPIALGDVRAIREHRFSILRTTGAVAAVIAPVALFQFLKELSGMGGPTS